MAKTLEKNKFPNNKLNNRSFQHILNQQEPGLPRAHYILNLQFVLMFVILNFPPTLFQIYENPRNQSHL